MGHFVLKGDFITPLFFRNELRYVFLVGVNRDEMFFIKKNRKHFFVLPVKECEVF